MFDVLSGDGICQQCELHSYFFNNKADKEVEIPASLGSLGYESFNRIANMGSLSLFLILYTAKIIFLALLTGMMFLAWIKPYKKYAKRLMDYLYEGTFFNQILSILLESYFEFLLAAFLHLNYTND